MLAAAMTIALALTWSPPADTLIPVERGTRLQVENERGSVSIQSWERDALRIVTGAGPRADVGSVGADVRIRPAGGQGPAEMDFTITVPRWMDVRVQGKQVGVRVRGTEAEVVVETLGRDVVVDGGRRVSVRTIEGGITVRNARGPVEARAVNRSVTVENVVEDVSVETTNGNIVMRGVGSGSVQAGTVNGAVSYQGVIRDGGRYALRTHNGDISVTVPPASNVTVSAASYNGAFQSDFPVQLTGTRGELHYTFTLGAGSARLNLESFNGNIQLRRPAGAARP
jgi:DUF4097 and DUF4098 domain-containing protein YvlB